MLFRDPAKGCIKPCKSWKFTIYQLVSRISEPSTVGTNLVHPGPLGCPNSHLHEIFWRMVDSAMP